MLVFLGRDPKYYNSNGNRNLKKIVAGLLPAYIAARRNRRRGAKGELLEEGLHQARENGLTFVKIVEGEQQEATRKEARSKTSRSSGMLQHFIWQCHRLTDGHSSATGHLFRDLIRAENRDVEEVVQLEDTARASGPAAVASSVIESRMDVSTAQIVARVKPQEPSHNGDNVVGCYARIGDSEAPVSLTPMASRSSFPQPS